MDAWHDFFVAEVGASAALVGLLFVALSINIAQIIKYAWLPSRGAQVLVVLTGALLLASVPLIPAISPNVEGSVLIAIAGLTWLFSLLLVNAYLRGVRRQIPVVVPRIPTLTYAITAQLATLPAVVGGSMIFAGSPNGYYWIAAGLLFTIAFALNNAWVLLIEILR